MSTKVDLGRLSTNPIISYWVLNKEMKYKLVVHDHLDSVVHCKTVKRKKKREMDGWMDGFNCSNLCVFNTLTNVTERYTQEI